MTYFAQRPELRLVVNVEYKKPASNVKGITYHVSIATSVSIISVMFVANSINIMTVNRRPNAVSKAIVNTIYRFSMTVTRITVVIKLCIMAKLMVTRAA